jgi:hypothetical protein
MNDGSVKHKYIVFIRFNLDSYINEYREKTNLCWRYMKIVNKNE